MRRLAIIGVTALFLVVVSAAAADEFFGTMGDDTIVGTSGGDQIGAKEGDDTVYARGGQDFAQGNWDNDVIYGGSGADDLYGGRGADRVLAGCHQIYYPCDDAGEINELHGGEGGDTIGADNGRRDFVFGGSGQDTCYMDGTALDDWEDCETIYVNGVKQ